MRSGGAHGRDAAGMAAPLRGLERPGALPAASPGPPAHLISFSICPCSAAHGCLEPSLARLCHVLCHVLFFLNHLLSFRQAIVHQCPSWSCSFLLVGCGSSSNLVGPNSSCLFFFNNSPSHNLSLPHHFMLDLLSFVAFI